MSLLFVAIAIAAWLWSVSHGQFEDLDKAASSILFEDSVPGAAPPAASEDQRNPRQ